MIETAYSDRIKLPVINAMIETAYSDRIKITCN